MEKGWNEGLERRGDIGVLYDRSELGMLLPFGRSGALGRCSVLLEVRFVVYAYFSWRPSFSSSSPSSAMFVSSERGDMLLLPTLQSKRDQLLRVDRLRALIFTLRVEGVHLVIRIGRPCLRGQ